MDSAKEDIAKRKCNYCLALCSTVIVVTITIVSQTIISKTPLIWLKIAESQAGQIDISVSNNNVNVYEKSEKEEYTILS